MVADQQERQQGDQQNGQQTQSQFQPGTQGFQGFGSQQFIDQLFAEQMDPSGIEGWRAYADLVRHNVESFTRITEIQALRLAKHGVVQQAAQQAVTQVRMELPQLVPQIAQAVAQTLLANPQWLDPAIKRAQQLTHT